MGLLRPGAFGFAPATPVSDRWSLAFAVFGLGGTALFPGFGLADALALASGGIAAGGIFAIEALSVSDMDQLERWLRGVRGGTAASAFGSGMRTLMLRMLGGEKRVYDRRSTTFTAER